MKINKKKNNEKENSVLAYYYKQKSYVFDVLKAIPILRMIIIINNHHNCFTILNCIFTITYLKQYVFGIIM